MPIFDIGVGMCSLEIPKALSATLRRQESPRALLASRYTRACSVDSPSPKRASSKKKWSRTTFSRGWPRLLDAIRECAKPRNNTTWMRQSWVQQRAWKGSKSRIRLACRWKRWRRFRLRLPTSLLCMGCANLHCRRCGSLAVTTLRVCTSKKKPLDPSSLKHCGQCKFARYWSAVCQKAHWKAHKAECKEKAAFVVTAAMAAKGGLDKM